MDAIETSEQDETLDPVSCALGAAATLRGEGVGRVRRLSGVRALLGLAVAVVCVMLAMWFLWSLTGNVVGNRVNIAAEDKATQLIVRLLEGFALADCSFAGFERTTGDAWSSAEALRTLVLHREAGVRGSIDLAATARVLPSLALQDGGRFAGLTWNNQTDNTAYLQASADAALAVALAKGRVDDDVAPLGREILGWLLAQQNPDGSWSDLPVMGPRGAAVGATVYGLHALVPLAVSLGEQERVYEDCVRAAAWLVVHYREDGAYFDNNPARKRGGERSIAGQNEKAILALLGVRALTRRLGRPPQAELDRVVLHYAAALAPFTEKVDTLAAARPADYPHTALGLPEGVKTSFAVCRWLVYPWRLQVARALSREPGIANADAWEDELWALRVKAAELPEVFAERETWMLADLLYGLLVVRATDKAGSGVLDLIR